MRQEYLRQQTEELVDWFNGYQNDTYCREKPGDRWTYMLDNINMKHSVKRRHINHLITNMALRDNNIHVTSRFNGRKFALGILYRECKRSKAWFDPYSRGKEQLLVTLQRQEADPEHPGPYDQVGVTYAQLNFYRFAYLYQIIEYAMQHRDVIEDSLLQMDQRSTDGQHRRRSKATIRGHRETSLITQQDATQPIWGLANV